MTAAGTESWDGFWAEVTGGDRTETIRGITVRVPADIPLALEKRVDDLEESSELEDYAELVGMLFGEDILTRWMDAGMGLRELQTVLTWGLAHGSGQDMTFRQAYETVQAADEGKPPAPANRAGRRAAQKKPSAPTGGRSKRTSSASTDSARKTSPA